ncbi:MAG: CBS domain-containing protein [Planctomycetes bacterium]|nr:CBS domain-containing protein [Planctomycetota bacterium]
MQIADLIAGQELLSLPESAPVSEALELFRAQRISAAPLLDRRGRLAGLLTAGRLLQALHRELSPELLALLDPARSGSSPLDAIVRVADLALREPLTARPFETCRSAATRLLERGEHHLVVVDENRSPLAILSSQDFVRLAAAGPNPPAPLTTARAADWFQHVRLQHGELDTTIDRLRALCASTSACLPEARWRALLARELRIFREQLETHLAYEEEGGYLGELETGDEDHLAAVRRLAAEHEAIRSSLTRLEGPDMARRSIDEHRSGIARLLEALERHEREEDAVLAGRA